MERQVIRAEASRHGSWWVVRSAGVVGTAQGRTLAEAEQATRLHITHALNIPPEELDLDLAIERPGDTAEALAIVSALEERAEQAVTAAAQQRRAVARSLRETHGMSAIDAARVMGVSRARIYQLLDVGTTESDAPPAETTKDGPLGEAVAATGDVTSDRMLVGDTIPYEVVDSLDDLRGPAGGVVTLPHAVLWAPGGGEIDLASPGVRRMAYRALLNEGSRADLVQFLNREVLIEEWPHLLLPFRVVSMWESRFPELQSSTPA